MRSTHNAFNKMGTPSDLFHRAPLHATLNVKICSEDSFVNDGPLSYETCSSGEDDEEEMGDDTMPRLRKEGRQDDFDYTGDRRGSAGKDSITPEKSKKRKKVKRSRFEDADDEKVTEERCCSTRRFKGREREAGGYRVCREKKVASDW